MVVPLERAPPIPGPTPYITTVVRSVLIVFTYANPLVASKVQLTERMVEKSAVPPDVPSEVAYAVAFPELLLLITTVPYQAAMSAG